MKRTFRAIGIFFGVLLFLATSFNPALAQSQGFNAVYNSVGGTVVSPAFFDARMFLPPNSHQAADICGAIYGTLSGNLLTPPQTFTPGSVVDARGITGSTALTCAAGTTPWNNGTTPVSVPSTILLPAGTIVISTPWALPSNTHLIGEGENNPFVGTSSTPGTTIQSSSTLSTAKW